jgi:hypothetical protein
MERPSGQRGVPSGVSVTGGLEGKMTLVPFVQRDNQFRAPPFVAQLIEAQGIAGFVKTRDLDWEPKVIAGLMHGEESEPKFRTLKIG